jgi:hypothetical protein
MNQGHEERESTKRKLFITFVVVALMAGLGVFVTSAAFTATTENTGNRIESGSVAIGDSDGASGVLYDALDQKPGSGNGPTAKCIRVTYSGSLASKVHIYRSAVTNGENFRLKVERGSGISGPAPDSTMHCSNFTASSVAFDDTLDNFPATYGAGVAGKASDADWTASDSVDYRFTIYTVDDPDPNDHTSKLATTAHSFTWEAQNN